MKRTAHLLLSAAAGFFAAGAVQADAAEKYPSRPVRMIVPFQPGGASDFVGRIIEPRLARELGPEYRGREPHGGLRLRRHRGGVASHA